MDDTKVTPEAEEIASAELPTEEKKVEGTVDALIPKEEKAPEPKVVPEAAFLSLKNELKELKRELKEAKSSDQKAVLSAGMDELSKKYPDVSPEFIQDMLSSATKEATKSIEEKYTPIIAKQEQKEKQIAFDKAFDNLFDKTIQDNPDLPKSIDKDVVKALAVTPQYRTTPLADILIKLYGQNIQGKSSSENSMRSGADRVDDIVNFDKITPEQLKVVKADPKLKEKYFSYLDSIGR